MSLRIGGARNCDQIDKSRAGRRGSRVESSRCESSSSFAGSQKRDAGVRAQSHAQAHVEARWTSSAAAVGRRWSSCAVRPPVGAFREQVFVRRSRHGHTETEDGKRAVSVRRRDEALAPTAGRARETEHEFEDCGCTAQDGRILGQGSYRGSWVFAAVVALAAGTRGNGRGREKTSGLRRDRDDARVAVVVLRGDLSETGVLRRDCWSATAVAMVAGRWLRRSSLVDRRSRANDDSTMHEEKTFLDAAAGAALVAGANGGWRRTERSGKEERRMTGKRREENVREGRGRLYTWRPWTRRV